MKWRGREGLLHLNGFKVMRSEKEHCSAVSSGEIPKAETFSCLQDASLEAFSKLTSKMIGPNFIQPVPHLWFFSSSPLIFFLLSRSLPQTTGKSLVREARPVRTPHKHLFVGILIWIWAYLMDGAPWHILSTVEKDCLNFMSMNLWFYPHDCSQEGLQWIVQWSWKCN